MSHHTGLECCSMLKEACSGCDIAMTFHIIADPPWKMPTLARTCLDVKHQDPINLSGRALTLFQSTLVSDGTPHVRT